MTVKIVDVQLGSIFRVKKQREDLEDVIAKGVLQSILIKHNPWDEEKISQPVWQCYGW